jgi:hypothetical protein
VAGPRSVVHPTAPKPCEPAAGASAFPRRGGPRWRAAPHPRVLGVLQGNGWIADDSDAPLDEECLLPPAPTTAATAAREMTLLVDTKGVLFALLCPLAPLAAGAKRARGQEKRAGGARRKHLGGRRPGRARRAGPRRGGRDGARGTDRADGMADPPRRAGTLLAGRHPPGGGVDRRQRIATAARGSVRPTARRPGAGRGATHPDLRRPARPLHRRARLAAASESLGSRTACRSPGLSGSGLPRAYRAWPELVRCYRSRVRSTRRRSAPPSGDRRRNARGWVEVEVRRPWLRGPVLRRTG